MNESASIALKGVRDFDARQTFECGQAFRWNRACDAGYTGVAFGRAVRLSFASPAATPGEGIVTIQTRGRAISVSADSGNGDENGGGDGPLWESYLDLNRDYGAIKRVLTAKDAVMARAVAHGAGIRILRQEPWEALISFIVSQNNHIPRIKRCIERLCENFGERIDCADGAEAFAFPSVAALAALSSEDLAPCGLGYRARYLVETARRVAENGGAAWLDGLRAAPLAEAEAALLSLCGVGAKVASCVLLFGLGRTEGFPVDVWMARAARTLYGIGAKDAAADAATRFGPYAGFAQQYLFHYMRTQKSAHDFPRNRNLPENIYTRE
jgi:N-glycosylase/DNA lyase